MKTNQEIEFKNRINETEYAFLKNKYEEAETLVQINHYFDSERLALRKSRRMFRVREIQGKYVFTLKKPYQGHRLEIEGNVEGLSLKEEVLQALFAKEKIPPLVYLGFLKTIRTTWSDHYGMWCLDKNEYVGTVDYEIEYELFGPHPEAFHHFLQQLSQWGIKPKKEMGKYARFLKKKGLI